MAYNGTLKEPPEDGFKLAEYQGSGFPAPPDYHPQVINDSKSCSSTTRHSTGITTSTVDRTILRLFSASPVSPSSRSIVLHVQI